LNKSNFPFLYDEFIFKKLWWNSNILINIGPTKEGTIPVIFEESLRQLGAWLQVNGEAIYQSRPWTYQNDTTNPDVWYTKRAGNVYAILLEHPANGKVVIAAPLSTQISLLGYTGQLDWHALSNKGMFFF
jgi:alpha-L-fucosidase